ncbi:MAG: hypothetical protein V3S69_04795 [Dehalococcoidales bacterium]
MVTPVQTTLGDVAFAPAQVGIDQSRLDELRAQLEIELANPDVSFVGDAQERVETPNERARALQQQIGRLEGGSFRDIDELITERAPEAIDILRSGADEQLRLARLARDETLAPLRQIDDLRAFEERQSLLGLRGQEAQEAAIGNIPVSEFDQELQRRQTQRLRRQAAASGELGGGASLLGQQQLAGAQQADIIQARLSELQPLVALSRGVRGDISTATEQGLAEEAQLQLALGTQVGNIRLGAAAPAIQSTQEQAQLRGLRGIASANQRNQALGTLAGLAGSFIGGQ